MNLENRVTQIDAVLPQTQCQQCGYPRCRDYAQALAQGLAPINRCPPGGDETIAHLARVLNESVVALDSSLGEHRPPVVAKIREHECIGCTLCIQACPTDAIVGRAKLMHTVIRDDCSGCELCLPVCPVDCIDTLATPGHSDKHSLWTFYSRAQAEHYRWLTQRRLQRLSAPHPGTQSTQHASDSATEQQSSADAIRTDIAAAVARTRARRKAHP